MPTVKRQRYRLDAGLKREVAGVEPLSKDEEARLLQKLGRSKVWNEEQEKAAKRLIEIQLWSVVRVAERHSSSGIPTLDLIEQGNLSLLKAVRSFAQAPNGDFAEYATASIEGAIQKFVANQDK